MQKMEEEKYNREFNRPSNSLLLFLNSILAHLGFTSELTFLVYLQQSVPLSDVDMKLHLHHHSELAIVSSTCVARRKSSVDGRRISLQSIDCPDVMEVFEPL